MEIGTIKQVDIQQEMQVAYLDYAMSVIVARALPDVRDGLKPVHRRILYAMQDMGLTSDKPYKKSARIVGEVLGKYHPHGDSAVYDAMVRMAQDFSLRYMLVDGQGNFGSIDGDNPAAMRYTEARLAELANEMMADLEKDTIDWTPNFDGTLQEPSVLPAALPNLLVNGASGIAVGMTTNIPPHNLGEVCDALVYLLDHYSKVEDVTVEELMRFIKGPDFPTGGIVYRFGANGGTEDEDVIARAYGSGRGHFRVQAQAHIEEMSRNRNRIVVTELPYQVNKTNLIERIAELAREEKIEGITDLRDESDRTGMRIIIEMTRNVDPRSVLADLYKYTPMQQTFGMTMLALVDGEPRMLSLRRVLQHYIEHRREIIRRRSDYELKRAKERAHIVEGLLRALDILDEVIRTIRSSQTTDTARTNLVRNFKFTEIQAQAILDMPLKRLAALERKKLQDEYDELLRRIAYLQDLLAHPHKILGVIKDDVIALKQKYGDARRTQIVGRGASRASLTMRDMVADEPVLVALSRNGTLLRESLVERRKGKLPTRAGDQPLVALAPGRMHDEIFLFATDGRMARIAAHRLPDGSPIHAADLGAFPRNSRLAALLLLAKDQNGDQERFLVLATRDGRVKRVELKDAWAAIGVTTAMNVEEGDELIGAAIGDGKSEIMLVTKLGQSIRFEEAEVRPMGLPAAGVWGMKLSSGDEVVSLCITRPKSELVVATTLGYFKRTPLEQYALQKRHGGGIAAIKLGQRSGVVADARIAVPGDEFFSVSRQGVVRRIDFQEIPSSARSGLGKLLVEPAKNDSVETLLHLSLGRRPEREGGGGQPAAPGRAPRQRKVEAEAGVEAAGAETEPAPDDVPEVAVPAPSAVKPRQRKPAVEDKPEPQTVAVAVKAGGKAGASGAMPSPSSAAPAQPAASPAGAARKASPNALSSQPASPPASAPVSQPKAEPAAAKSRAKASTASSPASASAPAANDKAKVAATPAKTGAASPAAPPRSKGTAGPAAKAAAGGKTTQPAGTATKPAASDKAGAAAKPAPRGKTSSPAKPASAPAKGGGSAGGKPPKEQSQPTPKAGTKKPSTPLPEDTDTLIGGGSVQSRPKPIKPAAKPSLADQGQPKDEPKKKPGKPNEQLSLFDKVKRVK